MEKRIKLVYYLWMNYLVTGTLGCNITEEGKPFEIRYTYVSPSEDGLMLSWFKDDQLLADCPVDTGDCITTDVNWFHARLERHNNSFDYIVNIPNVSRVSSISTKGSWTLETHNSLPVYEKIYSCIVQVYAKPHEVYCETTWFTDELKIKCRTTLVYPEAMMMVDIKNRPSSIISCESTHTSKDPIYYKAECTVKIPTNELNYNKNDINLYIYPNIIGTYINIGINVSITIVIAISAVEGKICIDREKYVECWCLKLYGEKDVKFVDWYLNNTAVSSKGERVKLYKKKHVTEELDYITCRLELQKDFNLLIVTVACFVPIILILISLLLTNKICQKGKCCFKSTKKFKKIEEKELEEVKVPLTIRDKDIEFDATPVLLLTGTRNSNKHIIGDKILYRYETTGAPADYNGPQLYYSRFGARVIKLVDVPNFDGKDTTKYQEDLKSSLCLSPEGYSIFILVSTIEEINDTLLMIYMLADEFGKEVINYILVFIMTSQDPGSKYNINVRPLKELCDDRCLLYSTEASPSINKTVYGLIDDWSYSYANHHFKIRYEKAKKHTSILFEKIYKELCLMLHDEKKDAQLSINETSIERIKSLQKNWDDWRQFMNLSESAAEDLQSILDYFILLPSKPAGSNNEHQTLQKSLQSLRYELIKSLTSERKPLISQTLTWNKIVEICKKK